MKTVLESEPGFSVVDEAGDMVETEHGGTLAAGVLVLDLMIAV
jgi:hypothetical protein